MCEIQIVGMRILILVGFFLCIFGLSFGLLAKRDSKFETICSKIMAYGIVWIITSMVLYAAFELVAQRTYTLFLVYHTLSIKRDRQIQLYLSRKQPQNRFSIKSGIIYHWIKDNRFQGYLWRFCKKERKKEAKKEIKKEIKKRKSIQK